MGFGGEVDVTTSRALLPRRIRNRMSIFDVRVGCKSIGHGISHVDTFSYFLDRCLQPCDSVRQVVDCIEFPFAMHSLIVFRGFARRTLGGQLVRVAQVLRQVLLELADSVIMRLNKLWQILNIATDHCPGDGID